MQAARGMLEWPSLFPHLAYMRRLQDFSVHSVRFRSVLLSISTYPCAVSPLHIGTPCWYPIEPSLFQSLVHSRFRRIKGLGWCLLKQEDQLGQKRS